MLELLDAAGHFVAASSDDSEGGGKLVILLLVLGGPAFYALMYTRYRNQDKREHYEATTKAEMDHVGAIDTFNHSETRLRNSKMHGANNTTVRGARSSSPLNLGALGNISSLGDLRNLGNFRNPGNPGNPGNLPGPGPGPGPGLGHGPGPGA